MTNGKKRIGFVIVLLALVSGTTGGLARWASPTEKWCKVTEDWAVTLKGDSLPTTLDQFSEIPRRYRRAVFNHMSHEARARVQAEALQELLDSRTLTPAQAEVVERAIAEATPDSYREAEARNREWLKTGVEPSTPEYLELKRRLVDGMGCRS